MQREDVARSRRAFGFFLRQQPFQPICWNRLEPLADIIFLFGCDAQKADAVLESRVGFLLLLQRFVAREAFVDGLIDFEPSRPLCPTGHQIFELFTIRRIFRLGCIIAALHLSFFLDDICGNCFGSAKAVCAHRVPHVRIPHRRGRQP